MKPLVQPSLLRSGCKSAPRRNPPSAPATPYSVFVAYSSVEAARDALARVTALSRTRDDKRPLRPMLWRCDQLDDPRWREMALNDAARSDVLVLAFARNAPISPATEAWLAHLAKRMGGSELTALAFMGDDEGWTISLRALSAHPVATRVPAGASRNGAVPSRNGTMALETTVTARAA